jgi:hypothetical protein
LYFRNNRSQRREEEVMLREAIFGDQEAIPIVMSRIGSRNETLSPETVT